MACCDLGLGGRGSFVRASGPLARAAGWQGGWVGAAGPPAGWGLGPGLRVRVRAWAGSRGRGEGGAAGRKGWGRRGARAPARTSSPRRWLPRAWPPRASPAGAFLNEAGAEPAPGGEGAGAWLPAARGGAASNQRLPFMVITLPARPPLSPVWARAGAPWRLEAAARRKWAGRGRPHPTPGSRPDSLRSSPWMTISLRSWSTTAPACAKPASQATTPPGPSSLPSWGAHGTR